MDLTKNEFASLLDSYMLDLYRYAYWLVGNKEIAEDLVQETFLRAWRYKHTLKSADLTKSWLITILKRENARRFESAQGKAKFSDIPMDEFAANETNLDTRPEAFALHQALNNLSLDNREPLLLQVIWGFSGKEIAVMLNISPEAVMTRLHRAKTMLKKQLLAEDESDDKNNGEVK